MSKVSKAVADPGDGAVELPKKENEMFKTVVKCYETKQYKKGMKQAELVLKKYPNHGGMAPQLIRYPLQCCGVSSSLPLLLLHRIHRL